MTEITKVFEGVDIRIVEIEGNPWFIAKNIASILGYSDAEAMTRHLDYDEKQNLQLVGFKRGAIVINEAGLYSAILRSRKPKAKTFKRWVTHEVLPSIRKNGAYMTPETLERTLKDPDFLIGLLENLKAEKQRNEALEIKTLMLEQQVAESEPKVSYYDTILQSTGTVNITQIGKDYGLSGIALNKILEEEKVQYKMSGQWLLYSKYQNKGFTKSKTVLGNTEFPKLHTQWTQKGRLFIHEILTKRGIRPIADCA